MWASCASRQGQHRAVTSELGGLGTRERQATKPISMVMSGKQTRHTDSIKDLVSITVRIKKEGRDDEIVEISLRRHKKKIPDDERWSLLPQEKKGRKKGNLTGVKDAQSENRI